MRNRYGLASILGLCLALGPAVDARALPQTQSAAGSVTVDPPLSLRGHTYVVRYDTDSPERESSAIRLFDTTLDTFERRRITRIVVSRDGVAVADPNELADVFWAYTAAALLYDRATDFDLGSIPSTFRDDLHRVTTNPLFIDQRLKAALKGPQQETLEALRAILAPSSASREVTALIADTQAEVEDGHRVVNAVGDVIETMKWSESRSLRAIQRDVGRAFADWRPVAVAGSAHLDIGGQQIELLNGLDVIAFGLRVIALGDLSADRAEWLVTYRAIHAPPDGELNDDQSAAAGTAIDEAAIAGVQELDVFGEFVREEAVEFAGRVGEKVIAENAAKWLANRAGLQFSVHRMVSAAGAVGIGLTLGEVLLGTGEMYSHMRIAERADELRLRGRATRLVMQREVRGGDPPAEFNGDLAMEYRSAYMLESLAAAQAHRSYADGVGAMVEPGLRQKLNPVSWIKGDEWRAAVQGLRAIAAAEESAAEAETGHPAYVAAAVTLAVESVSGGENPPNRPPRPDPDAASRKAERATAPAGPGGAPRRRRRGRAIVGRFAQAQGHRSRRRAAGADGRGARVHGRRATAEHPRRDQAVPPTRQARHADRPRRHVRRRAGPWRKDPDRIAQLRVGGSVR